MRERDKWRDRFEISLDNRQIFALFSLVAIVLSLTFALGVVVGRRTGPDVADKPRTDPLALLDQLAGEQSDPPTELGVASPSGMEASPSGDASVDAAASRPPNSSAAPEAPSNRARAGDEGAYALQLSSFQEKLEADQFVAQLRASGLAPRIVPARIPGRGIWYRVRIGSFASWEEAVTAKDKFEREHNLVAYVARQSEP